LRNNSQIKEVVKQKSKQKKDENDKQWWKKRVEELSKGMKEASIKR
jgi:hypothetical protein